HMTSRLNNRGFSVVALSGELSQNERTHALQAMRDGRARVCVATDVAARGIDLPNLELVIHADIPKNRESLLHRSGRTGRAGRKGVCTLIVPHNMRKRTERLLGSANIGAAWAKPPSASEIMVRDRERILEDPALSAPLSEFEQTFVQELLAKHSAEQVAAAFLRQNFAERTAPEELIETGPVQAKQQQTSREDFKNGVWFSLSVGRDQNAEPRWLLPMLCRAGHITKNEIGAIRIQQAETFVELTRESVEKFIEAVGPGGKVDKGVILTRLDGIPDVARGSSKKPFAKKKPYNADKPGGRGDFKPRNKFAKDKRDGDGGDKSPDKPRDKPWEKSRDKPGDKPWLKSKGKPKEKTRENTRENTWDTAAKKPTAKKPYKSQFDKAGPAEPGSSPLKRKKKKKKPAFK
ncbi:MAG: DEAD/DEAH box helicase, partial [Rhodospirillales bacterium]|nr:DEAD/DEAH box helicase [Rhodospirillales bacterium]